MQPKPSCIIFGIFVIIIVMTSVTVITLAQNDDFFWNDVFNDHGSIMLLIDIDTGKILRANKAASAFYGYSVEQLESMHIDDIHLYSPFEVQQERLAAAREERNHFIFPHQLANGEVRTVEVHSYPVNKGNEAFLFSVINDITTRQLAEQELVASNERLQKAELITAIGSWEFHLENDWFIPSEGAKQIMGLVGDSWTMTQISERVLPEYQGLRNQAYSELLKENKLYDIEFKFQRFSDGKIIDIRSIGEYDPETNTVFGVFHDITNQLEAENALKQSRRIIAYTLFTFLFVQLIVIIVLVNNVLWRKKAEKERKRSEIALREEKELFRTTLLSVGDGVIATDQNGCVKTLNVVAEQLTGWMLKDAIGKPSEEIFTVINAHTREVCVSRIETVLATGKAPKPNNHGLLIAKDGTERHVADSVAPIKDGNGDIQGVVLVFRDITDEKIQQETIEYLSYHDQLTEVYNRCFFEKELKNLDTENNLPLSVIVADLNGLKLANDAFGHKMGDHILKKAARLIQAACRKSDVVARWGGDEFIILLPKTSSADAETIANRIEEEFRDTNIDSVLLSASLGWGTKTCPEQNIGDVFDLAEKLMYRGKLLTGPSIRRETLKAIMATLHEKNKREEEHSKRVSELCKILGRKLLLSEREVEELGLIGLFHDIGKVSIDENILNKPGKLTGAEYEEVKRHPEIGYRILKLVKDMEEMAKSILTHHERWDGLGYPKGLKAEEIPLQARIVAVVDAYDAMISERPYRKSLSVSEALQELQANAGTQFDPNIVEIFIETLQHLG